MIAIASCGDSSSGDFIFTKKITLEEFESYKNNRVWDLARQFKDRINYIPENILVYDGDEEVARWYAGHEYPEDY